MASIYTQQINHILRIWYLVHFVGSNEPHKYTLTHMHRKKLYGFCSFFFSKKERAAPCDKRHSVSKFPCHIQSNAPFLKLSMVPLNLNACYESILFTAHFLLLLYTFLSPMFFFPGSRHTMNYAHWLCYRVKLQTDKFMCKLHLHVVLTCYDMHCAHIHTQMGNEKNGLNDHLFE